ncbi:MAG TPA: chloride channel protein, partial [Verrucomicrobiae bacterium]|nr:chloride channel protein [Verrucomicrobiae bacterium]
PWGAAVILVPVLGGIGVTFLVANFAPEAKGHGVPEVIDVIYYNRGRIRPVVAIVKSLASAISIGSGGSVGREGPIIQIGSSFGSTIGQILRVPAWQRIVLIAGGAGGGIAATFNTPVGGVLFALEIMMHEVSVRTLVPVALATAAGTYVGRLFFGQYPSFVIPALETPYFHMASPLVLLAYIGLGLVMGAVSALFIKSIYGAEDFFERRVGGSYYRQHLLGMLGVGLVLYGLMTFYGHYYVEGVGYSTVQEILSGRAFPLALLLLLFALKLLVTSLTLGSGASGGIFSPALFLGATLGSAYGTFLQWCFPQLGISPAAFAVAGMAGVVGGSTGAAMAAIVMIFEMTLDYNVIVPMTITVAVSYGIRKVLSRESIYSMKLVRRGHYVPEAMHSSPHLVQPVQKIMLTNFGRLNASCGIKEIAHVASGKSAPAIFLVDAGSRIVGILSAETILKALENGAGPVTAAELADRNYVTVTEFAPFFDVMILMRASMASAALVRDETNSHGVGGNIKGLITPQQLGEAMVESSGLFLD